MVSPTASKCLDLIAMLQAVGHRRDMGLATRALPDT